MRRALFHFVATVSMAATCMVSAVQAAVVSFGTGTNVFQMEFVTIGNPGNAPDSDPNARPISATLGSVGYTYGIGKFEVSEDMITKYNANFGTSSGLVITKDTRGPNKPATSISWNEAARFVNWLNTSSGGFAAYKFGNNNINTFIDVWTTSDTLDYDESNPFRSKRATYALPSYNEWYKAAFYNPANSTYYTFPNGRDTAPISVGSGTADNTAVYNRSGQPGPVTAADVDLAGGLSPYGVMALGGNVREWEESTFDVSPGTYNLSGSARRGTRDGDFGSIAQTLSSAFRGDAGGGPQSQGSTTGFRVVSLSSSSPPAVPEPSMMVIGTLFGLGGLMSTKRMKK